MKKNPISLLTVIAIVASLLLSVFVGSLADTFDPADPNTTLIAQWVATGSYSDVGAAVFYTRSDCAGTTTTANGTSNQNWGNFQNAFDHLADNQYMVISIDNLPNTDNATVAAGFELRGYKRYSTDGDSTDTYFRPSDNTDIVTVTKANSSNLTLTIDGPIYHNDNNKKEVRYNFSGLGGSIHSSSISNENDVLAADIDVTVSIYEAASEPSEEPSQSELVETVLIEKTAAAGASWSKTASQDAVGSWFLTMPKLRQSVGNHGAIIPQDGEYYKITLTGYVSSGSASLYLGENVSWEEHHGFSDPQGLTNPTSLSTTPTTIEVYVIDPIYAVEGDICLCDTGDIGHTITYTYVKVSEFRRANHLDPNYDPNGNLGFDPSTWNRTPDQITVAFYNAAATEYGVTWHTYSPEGTQVLQYVKQVGGVDDFTVAATVAASTETFETLTMPYDLEHNLFVYGQNVTTVADYSHKAVLTGLDYSSTYAYRVGDPITGVWSEVGHIHTRDENQGAFTFSYVSDTQVGAAANTAQCEYMHRALQGAVRNATPAFIVNGGDIVQSTKYLHLWRNQLNGSGEILRDIPFMPVTGNHDSIYAVAGDHEIYKHFNIDYPAENNVLEYGAFYSYDYGDAHFVVLNTDCFSRSNGALDATQLAWLEADLANNTQPWTIVLMHRPMFAIRQVATQANREQLLGLFNTYHVDLVIQAHEHVYMRSYPIDGTETVDTNPVTVTENGVEYFEDPNGVVFATFATGGADGKAPMEAAPKYFCHTYGQGYASSWANITINGDRLTVTACYETESGSQSYQNGTWGILKTQPAA